MPAPRNYANSQFSLQSNSSLCLTVGPRKDPSTGGWGSPWIDTHWSLTLRVQVSPAPNWLVATRATRRSCGHIRPPTAQSSTKVRAHALMYVHGLVSDALGHLQLAASALKSLPTTTKTAVGVPHRHYGHACLIGCIQEGWRCTTATVAPTRSGR